MTREGESPLILCIEDEADLRTDIVEELADAGYRTLEAGDGAEALKVIGEQRPDLILCDITMPGMDGYGVMQAIHNRRADLADVPFIFLTALAGRADLIQGKNAGADDYLVKPVDYDVMLATIRARLGQVERMQRSYRSALDGERQSAEAALMLRQGETMEASGRALDRLAAGLVVFDKELQIRHGNETASRLLKEGDGLVVSGGRLNGVTPAGSKALRQLAVGVLEDENSDRGLVLERPFRHPLLAHGWLFSRIEGHVALLLIDPETPPVLSAETAMRMFGLTPTEARLAVALASGQRLEDIAMATRTALTTVSFHLRNLFRKTQTGRQSDLVALILRTAIGQG